MKNIIKKISAVAMAFTLLGAGSATIKTIAPQTDNTIVAEAAVCRHDGRWYGSYGNWFYNPIRYNGYDSRLGNYTIELPRWSRYKYTKCSKCNGIMSSEIKHTYTNPN